MATKRKLNVLFVMADQLRYDFIERRKEYGISTPAIDALCEHAAYFKNAYTNSPVCGPARIALATGLLPVETGAIDNETSMLDAETPTLYKHLRAHGYHTELVGRHDLWKPGAPACIEGKRLLNKMYGFNQYLEIEGACSAAAAFKSKGVSGPYTSYLNTCGQLDVYARDYKYRRESDWFIDGNHDSALPLPLHQDVFIGDRAVERMRQLPLDQQWFMQVNFQAPHDPYDPPSEYGSMYHHKHMPRPIECHPQYPRAQYIQQRQGHWPLARTEQIEQARRQYAAKISLLDDQIGRLLEALRKRGFGNDTIVIFTSDHGDQLGDHGLWSKHTAYDSSWRIPLLITGPGIKGGEYSALVELADVNPTICAVLGLPQQEQIEAQSFYPILYEGAEDHRDFCICMEQGYQAIRTSTMKLICYDNGDRELFLIQTDPNERKNVAAEYKPFVEVLECLLFERIEGRCCNL